MNFLLSSQAGQMLAVLPVGLLPVLLLALLAAVEEGLAPATPQGDLALGLLPVVHGTVCANVFHDMGKRASVGRHLHCRQALERNLYEQGGDCHEDWKASTTRKVVHHVRPPRGGESNFGHVIRAAYIIGQMLTQVLPGKKYSEFILSCVLCSVISSALLNI